MYVYCAGCDIFVCDKSKVVASVNESNISLYSLHEVCMCVWQAYMGSCVVVHMCVPCGKYMSLSKYGRYEWFFVSVCDIYSGCAYVMHPVHVCVCAVWYTYGTVMCDTHVSYVFVVCSMCVYVVCACGWGRYAFGIIYVE